MKLSDGTIAVLKSFSQINSSIKITPGNTLATISPLKTLLAKATIEDTFESGFSIYDLSRFLGILSLFDAPEIEIRSSDLVIKGGDKKVVYRFLEFMIESFAQIPLRCARSTEREKPSHWKRKACWPRVFNTKWITSWVRFL
jgi:hypothetical protein